jgi:hypothetical protein
MIVEMGDYAWSEHIVPVYLACQITIKNVQVQLAVKGKTTPDSYTPIPKSSCAKMWLSCNEVFRWRQTLARPSVDKLLACIAVVFAIEGRQTTSGLTIPSFYDCCSVFVKRGMSLTVHVQVDLAKRRRSVQLVHFVVIWRLQATLAHRL